MKIVMLNGQNHKGSSYHVGRSIVDKIKGENEVTEFFFPKDLNHFCMGCYQCIEDVTKCYRRAILSSRRHCIMSHRQG